MTNLLPPAAKKQIVLEYWTRVLCAWIVLWSVCLCVGVVLLWPTYVLLSGNNAAYAESADAATELVGEYETMSAALTVTSQQAVRISSLSEEATLSAMLEEIWGTVTPDTIEVTSVRLSRSDGDLQPFSISGEAADRQSLAEFKNQLESLSFISSVDLPFENLAKNEDISFSLAVEVTDE